MSKESEEMTAAWRDDQQKMRGLSDAMAALDSARAEVAIAMRNGDYEKASALQYGKIPELEEQIKKQTVNLRNTKLCCQNILRQWCLSGQECPRTDCQ